jgi:hypothetical protein
VFRRRPPTGSSLSSEAPFWASYLRVQGQVLSDSVLSFNSAHDRVKRCETSHIRDGTWLTDELAHQGGLRISVVGSPAARLWQWAHVSYSLERSVAEYKFGPSYVVCETPADNVRLTTFFAGENEVRAVDPRRVQVVDAIGCRVA